MMGRHLVFESKNKERYCQLSFQVGSFLHTTMIQFFFTHELSVCRCCAGISLIVGVSRTSGVLSTPKHRRYPGLYLMTTQYAERYISIAHLSLARASVAGSRLPLHDQRGATALLRQPQQAHPARPARIARRSPRTRCAAPRLRQCACESESRGPPARAADAATVLARHARLGLLRAGGWPHSTRQLPHAAPAPLPRPRPGSRGPRRSGRRGRGGDDGAARLRRCAAGQAGLHRMARSRQRLGRRAAGDGSIAMRDAISIAVGGRGRGAAGGAGRGRGQRRVGRGSRWSRRPWTRPERDRPAPLFSLEAEQASDAGRPVAPAQRCTDSCSPRPRSRRSAAAPRLRLPAPSMPPAGGGPPPAPSESLRGAMAARAGGVLRPRPGVADAGGAAHWRGGAGAKTACAACVGRAGVNARCMVGGPACVSR